MFLSGKISFMIFNAGIIGCSGSRFKEIYLPFFIDKHKTKKINFLKIYNRTQSAAVKLSKTLESKVANNIDEILNDKDINLIFLVVPYKIRREILSKKIDSKKIVISEVPLVKNIFDYFFFLKKIRSNKVNLYVFEDRYYFYKRVFKRNINETIDEIILNNIEWLHHAYGAVAALDLEKKLIKIDFKKGKVSDEFQLIYNKIKFKYIFNNNKKDNIRENGNIIFKKVDGNKEIIHLTKSEYQSLKKDSIYFFFNDNESSFLNFSDDNYLRNHLKNEAIFCTIVKIFKSFKSNLFAKILVIIFIKLGILV